MFLDKGYMVYACSMHCQSTCINSQAEESRGHAGAKHNKNKPTRKYKKQNKNPEIFSKFPNNPNFLILH